MPRRTPLPPCLCATVLVVYLGSTALSQSGVEISRLPIAAFPEVPLTVKRRIAADQCLIPQLRVDRRDNVISGEFARPGQRDWMLFCTREDGATTIKLYWGGSARCPVPEFPIDPGPPKVWTDQLRTVSRARLSADVKTLKIAAPLLTHDGVAWSDEKVSSTQYCDKGRWVQLFAGD